MREEKNKGGKIYIGRLAVDSVFLAVFVFFTISALSMITYIILSSR